MTSLHDLVPDNTDVVVGSLCTGYGGLDLGLLAALGGGRIAWVADPDPHVSSILATRVPGVPNLGDVRDIDWAAVEPVDVVTAGFPCQDISAAGRRAGIEKGERSGIWSDIVAGIRVLRPALLVVENVAALRWRNGGLHRVLGDLAEAGYDALWRSVRAADVGCAHRRERVFLLAWPRRHGGDVRDPHRARRQFQWHQRSQQTGRPVIAGPTAVAANTDGGGFAIGGHSDRAQVRPPDPQGLRNAHGLRSTAARSGRGQAERRRGDQPLAGAPRAASPAEEQQQWNGHAVVNCGEVAADTSAIGRDSIQPPHSRCRSVSVRPVPPDSHTVHVGQRCSSGACGVPATHSGNRLDEEVHRSTRIEERPHAARHPFTVVPDLPAEPTAASQTSHAVVDWGEYTPAVRRWERLLGRAAPYPTQPGQHSRPVLSARFVEFLMGLDNGFVSSLDIPRTAQLRALGNGVVPQQAVYAIRLLLEDLAAVSDLDLEGGWAA